MEAHEDELDVFALAQERMAVCVELDVADVRSIRPGWTMGRAERFLKAHRASIAATMLAAGLMVVVGLIQGEGGKDE